MFPKAFLPLTIVALLLSGAAGLSARSADTENEGDSRERIDLEFEIRSIDLERKLAELEVEEAEIAVAHVKLALEAAKSADHDQEVQRIQLDHKKALVQLEAQRVRAQMVQLHQERVQTRLEFLRRSGSATKRGPEAQIQAVEDSGVIIFRGAKHDVAKIASLIRSAEGREAGEPSSPDRPMAAAERELLQQRRDTLRKLVEILEARFRQGETMQRPLIEAQNALIAAELELAVDQPQRIALLEKKLANLKQLMEMCSAMHQSGQVPYEQVLASQAESLRAEVELLRERSAQP
jgi:hypothetical protein